MDRAKEGALRRSQKKMEIESVSGTLFPGSPWEAQEKSFAGPGILLSGITLAWQVLGPEFDSWYRKNRVLQ